MSMAAAPQPVVLPANLGNLLKLLKERDKHAKKTASEYERQLETYVHALEQELETISRDRVIGERIQDLRREKRLPAGVVPPSSVCFYCGRSY